MKRLLSILAFSTFVIFAFTSCEKDNAPDFEEPQLIVTESDVIFDMGGGEGFIKLSAPGAVKATSNVDWCQASVSGMTVNLQVAENLSYVGRTATVTIESGKEKVQITAVQKARVFWLKDFRESTIAFSSEGSTVESEVVSGFPITVVEKPDWVEYVFEGNMLYLTAEAGIPSKGKIVFESEGRTLSFDLVRFSYAGLLGDWELEYKNASKSLAIETAIITLEEKVKDQSFNLTGLPLIEGNIANIHVSFSPISNNLVISAGQYLMTAANERVVYLCMRTHAGRYTWANAELEAALDIGDDGSVTYTFLENGTYAEAAGIGFYYFTGEPPSSATSTGSSIIRMMDPIIRKL